MKTNLERGCTKKEIKCDIKTIKIKERGGDYEVRDLGEITR
jgi:hypothetical protein